MFMKAMAEAFHFHPIRSTKHFIASIMIYVNI